ncbi:MAG: UPF0755 protein [Oceanicoccus sp.]|jgi:UPF0755 protein
MEKRILQLIAALIAVTVIWNLWNPLWKLDLNEAADLSDTEKVTFVIEKGQSAKSIASSLDDADLIIDKISFLRTLKTEELDVLLQFGSYRLSPSMTLREIITVLTTQGTGERSVTIIEGWTIAEIDDYLFEVGLAQDGDFEICIENCSFDYDFIEEASSLEGYLFPDTYFVDSATFSVEGFINLLLSTFDSRITDEMITAIENSDRSLDQIVNVASMIEKEVRTENDIPIVAGIIWNRLDNDWTLGIDATLLYVQEDNELTASDLAMDSPYNTRLNTGLVPTAICSPGLSSLMGAIYPEESDYWFYLTTLDTGEVIYAETNEGHEENKAKYL